MCGYWSEAPFIWGMRDNGRVFPAEAITTWLQIRDWTDPERMLLFKRLRELRVS